MLERIKRLEIKIKKKRKEKEFINRRINLKKTNIKKRRVHRGEIRNRNKTWESVYDKGGRKKERDSGNDRKVKN